MLKIHPNSLRTLIFSAALGLFCVQTASAGQFLDRLRERRQAQPQEQGLDAAEEGASVGSPSLPAGSKIIRNVAYGSDAQQSYDVYHPANAADAPVIFMVHGGGWARGDKTARGVVQNKAQRWVAKGFVFISVNYRMLPNTDPIAQASDIASALAFAQKKAATYGGDSKKFILMGHSAGAHLVSFLAASPQLATQAGAKPWLGTVALDSAAFDVERIMQTRHFGLYDKAFGTDPAYWRAASPFHVVAQAGAPLLAVCSSRRAEACDQAQRFATKANTLGMHVSVLPQPMSHGEINAKLGEANTYTRAVEEFMAVLDTSVALRLQ